MRNRIGAALIPVNDQHSSDLKLTFAAKVAILAALLVTCGATLYVLFSCDWAAVLYGYFNRVDDAQRLDPRESVYARAQGDRLMRATPPELNSAAEQYKLALYLSPLFRNELA